MGCVDFVSTQHIINLNTNKMNFSQLQRGCEIYILFKSALTNDADPTIRVEAGTVETAPVVPFGAYYYPIDISVRVGGNVIPYQGLPANAESAKVTSRITGENVVVVCSKDALNKEVQDLRQEAINNINAFEFNKRRLDDCDRLLKQLNPELAEKERNEEEMLTMRQQLSDMQKQMQKQEEINTQLLSMLKEKNESKSK